MRTAVAMVAVVLVAVTLSAVGAQRSSPQVLFEKALALEEVQGKLTEAIAVYEKIVGESGDKALAAQAQLHVGLCYEKMGLEKAREAYEKVVKNYPGQAAAVAMAQEKLNNIQRAAPAAKKGAADLVVRNVPFPPAPPLELYGVSPDGRYIAYIDARTGDLGVRELSTGSQSRLTDEGKDYSQYTIFPRWSPDSSRLVYAWNESQLRVVALGGSPPRVLVGENKEEWISPLDWSPDGRQILLVGASRRQRAVHLSLVAAADGSVSSLKTFADRNVSPGDCRFSPDGRAIAYSRANQDGVRERDVFLLSLDGGRENPLIQHPADDVFLEWLPDGRGILFASDRAGTFDLWTVPIDMGQAQGTPTLIKRGIGPITSMGLARTGAFYYRTPAPFTDVYTASLDPRTGLVVGSPKKEPLPYEGHNMLADWSPDGKRLAYFSMRPGERQRVLCIYSADTGKVREFRFDKTYSYPKWSPDGRYLYFQATVADGQGIYRMDMQSGVVTPFLGAAEKDYLHDLQVSADGNWIVYARDSKNVCQILRRDARSGQEQELDRTSFDNSTLALSRDGRRLASILRVDAKTRVLKMMDFPDGTPKEIARFALSGSFIICLAWSPDGRFIYYCDNPTDKGSDWHLRRIPAEGGDAQDLGLAMRYYRQLSVHPDGSRITFSAPPTTSEPPQVWVMENFLPATKR